MDGGEEVLGGELLVGAAGGPGDADAELGAFLEPESHLLDGALFEIVGEGRLAWLRSGAGEDVAARVSNAGKAKC